MLNKNERDKPWRLKNYISTKKKQERHSKLTEKKREMNVEEDNAELEKN